MGLSDPNRQGGIFNVNFPNSHLINFYLETDVYLSEEENSSPILLELPVDIAYAGSPFVHIPNAFDADGDRLEYRLAEPLMNMGLPALNYQQVDEVNPGANNVINIDSETGLLSWDAPQTPGPYVIAIEILSYRNGEVNGRVLRDMQIEVFPQQNLIPSIGFSGVGNNEINEVFPGDVISINVASQDPVDPASTVQLSSSSPLYFVVSPPATFESNGDGTATFEWVVTDDLVREEPYQVVFQATDLSALANYTVARFKVSPRMVSTLNIEDQKIKVFPNPVHDQLNIHLPQLSQNEIEIFDATGKYLSKTQIENGQRLDVSGLVPGTYYFKLSDGRTASFIKL